MEQQNSAATDLGAYLASAGGYFHADLYGKQDAFGTSIYTSKPLSAGSKVVCCPFALAVTPTLARQCIPVSLLPSSPTSQRKTRQPNHELMCLYLCLHTVTPQTAERVSGLSLQHRVYVDDLPSSESMRTTLYFSPSERELLRGSNLFGATEDRERGWKEEWEEVQRWLADMDVRKEVTWERWLWACTILSSRAFPSSLIDGDKENSTPVLFPGIDMLNHRPTAKLTWSSDVHVETVGTGEDGKKGKGSLTIVLDEDTPADEQVFNTYGAKSNEELLLGYGFVLPSNPADFVALKLALPPTCSAKLFDLIHSLKLDNLRHFVPRSGELPPELFAQMRLLMASEEEIERIEADSHAGGAETDKAVDGKKWEALCSFVSWENELDVLDALEGMLHGKLEALEGGAEVENDARDDVREMVEIYRRGQLDILAAAVEYRDKVFEETLKRAEEDGVQLAFEDDMEDIDEEEEE
ncbi:hypothetical protein JCM6882_004797 [Rhodosporidiobolus microsporus]